MEQVVKSQKNQIKLLYLRSKVACKYSRFTTENWTYNI